MHILVTGGCGFIGHHIVEHFVRNTDYKISIIDKLTYASNGFERLKGIDLFDNPRLHIYTTDITQKLSIGLLQEMKDVDYVLHLAAESHVDNSIQNPEPFVLSNVLGTMHILNFTRKFDNLKGFCYFSTDEVYGPAPEGTFFKESDRYNAGNPYSATKAGGEQLALSYGNTYGMPIFSTNCMNAFGERQHSEKFIPICIRNILENKLTYIHSDPTKTKSGTRFYIHARNIAQAIYFLLDKFKKNEKYNIVGEREVSNLEMLLMIGEIMGKEPKYEMIDFHSNRPGHDLRYALDGTKMKEMGWKIPVTFEKSLEKTVKWTLDHPEWLYLGKE